MCIFLYTMKHYRLLKKNEMESVMVIWRKNVDNYWVFTSDCGRPEPPENGTLVFKKTTEGNEAVYFCFKDFKLKSGLLVRKCGSDGNWSGDTPKCSKENFTSWFL